VKTTCDPVGDASNITHSRLNREAALTVTRRSENGRTCAPQAMAMRGRGVARLRCASFVAVVQAADLWNGEHASRSQRLNRT
jgi:hypothetical protein